MALFEPIKVGRYLLKHRIVLAPLTRARGEDNEATDRMVTYYEQRASDGGLLISEGTPISAEARVALSIPSIYKDSHVESWKKVTDAVHKKGGIIFAQLWHVGRSSHSAFNPKGLPPPSSAPVPKTGMAGTPTGPQPYEVPRAITREEIHEIIQDYVEAGKNSIAAGFDGVEIHSANGYLLDQFINDNINVGRTDEYGGTVENRVRFSFQVAEALAKAIGGGRVGIRLSPWSNFQGMGDSDPITTWSTLLKQLNKLDLAFVHLVEARIDGASDSAQDTTEKSLKPFREAYKGLMITAGGFLPDSAESVIAKKDADLVAFGRYFISNPDLPYRIQHGIPLTPYDRSTFYTNDETGYTDYPFADVSPAAKV
ncbi:NADH:flavin oxidoreductase/NADH oxidase [Chytridium lagenaria]|nr:NADH:flavin oxidoreductase/NADH oxidase [Chytridium lagenaria]